MALNDYEEVQDRKRESYENLVDKNTTESNDRYRAARREASGIPFGQPILVGHHSEKRHRAALKRINGNDDKSREASNKAAYFKKKLDNLDNKYAISSDDPDALKRLKDKLEGLVINHARMKETNRVIRSKPKNLSTPEKLDELCGELGYARATVNELFVSDYGGRFGLPGYMLSNSNQNIASVKKRIDSLQASRDHQSVTVKKENYIYYENAEANRVQFEFPGKPSEAVRKVLKSNAFKWAPSVSRWQRNLNNAGLAAARSAISELGRKARN